MPNIFNKRGNKLHEEIGVIKDFYGLDTDNTAIRLAVHRIAEQCKRLQGMEVKSYEEKHFKKLHAKNKCKR